MERSPLDSEHRREAAVFDRDVHGDVVADLDRMRAKLAAAEKQVSHLRDDIRHLESVIREFERIASINE